MSESPSPNAPERLAQLQERLQKLQEQSKDLARPGAIEALLQELATEVTYLQKAFSRIEPTLGPSRLAALATRIAAHFFVEKAMPRFCGHVLDEIIQDVGAGSGAVILFDPEGSGAKVVAARRQGRSALSSDDVRVSSTILSKIIDGEDSVLVEDALSDEVLADQDSVQELNLRSVLAIPLRFQNYLAGAIHLENEFSAGAFKEDDRALLLEVGRFVAIYLNAAFRLNEEMMARRRIYNEVKGKTHFDGIVGSSPRLLEVLDTVAQVGPSDATVVIEGETGTGKELIARALHLSSKRAAKPMGVVNCAAIPENLLESELFGHEKGAFTGAFERKLGRFEEANGGTVFLDEIAEMSIPLQAKILRFLQDRELQRLGSARTTRVDVRLVAATNRDIQTMVKQGEFREDLFWRLYVVPIRVPPLRDRAEDIPLLIHHFARVFALQTGREPAELDSEVYDCLQYYRWPGNIRELENLIQRLVVLSKDGRVRLEDLPDYVRPPTKITLEIQKNPFFHLMSPTPASYPELKRRRNQMHQLATAYAQKLDDRFIDAILDKAGGNISRAADQTGIHRTMIHRNLKARGTPRDS